jgi:hypothetical protein
MCVPTKNKVNPRLHETSQSITSIYHRNLICSSIRNWNNVMMHRDNPNLITAFFQRPLKPKVLPVINFPIISVRPGRA